MEARILWLRSFPKSCLFYWRSTLLINWSWADYCLVWSLLCLSTLRSFLDDSVRNHSRLSFLVCYAWPHVSYWFRVYRASLKCSADQRRRCPSRVWSLRIFSDREAVLRIGLLLLVVKKERGFQFADRQPSRQTILMLIRWYCLYLWLDSTRRSLFVLLVASASYTSCSISLTLLFLL